MFKGNPGFAKRQKEIARKERQKEKAQRRAERDAEKKRTGGVGGVDPDIAGIVPGPQPILGPDGLPLDPQPEPDADADDDDSDDDSDDGDKAAPTP
jgi:hypothetical protein